MYSSLYLFFIIHYLAFQLEGLHYSHAEVMRRVYGVRATFRTESNIYDGACLRKWLTGVGRGGKVKKKVRILRSTDFLKFQKL